MAGPSIRDRLSGLKKPRRGNTAQKKTKAQGTLSPRAGIGKGNTAPTGGEGGGGIASPLTEIDEGRTYYTTVRGCRSSDGLFVIEYNNIKTITTLDARQATVQFIYKDIDPITRK